MTATPNKVYTLLNTGDSVNTWGAGVGRAVSINDGCFSIMDLNLGGLFSKALNGVTAYSLTQANADCLRHAYTGAITADCTLTYPNVGSIYVIDNLTTGSFNVTITTGVGTPLTVTQGATTIITTDPTYGPKLANSAAGPVFIASGSTAAAGLVPTPPATAGSTKFLREDATWAVPVTYSQPPQGRLTLTTGTPVTTSNVSGTGTIYYDAYNGGNLVPVYSGTAFVMQTITGGEMTLTLNNPNHVNATLYDIFFFLDPGDGVTPVIGSGPAWSSGTSRGTGAGTTQLQTLNGIDTNAVAITARNGATTYSVSANKATYLGTFYTTATGQTSDSLTSRVLFNAYNEVRKSLLRQETTATWVYNSPTIRQANGSTSNQVNAVIGRAKHSTSIGVRAPGANSTANTQFLVGVGLNSTTVNSAASSTMGNVAVNGSYSEVTTFYDGSPGIGYWSFVWLEAVATGGSVTFAGQTTVNNLVLQSAIFGNVFV